MRLALCSPWPPARSGIADYTAALLPHLADRVALTLFADDPLQVDPALTGRYPTLPLDQLGPRRLQFSLPIYHMGNNSLHAAIYQSLCRYPGLVVLHEPYLHEFHAHQLLNVEQKQGAYSQELGYALGLDGLRLAQRALLGAAPLPLRATPLIERVLDVSLGILVHSSAAAARVRALRPNLPVGIIPHFAPSAVDGNLRAQLPWPATDLVFGTVGFLAANKRLDAALDAFASIRADRPGVRYLLVGEAPDSGALQAAIGARGLAAAVHHVPYVPDPHTFARWVNSVDVLVALREPTLGETSGTVLRGVAAGRPLVVYDHGWYSELPDDVARKVPPGQPAALQAALAELADRPGLCAAMGAAALTLAANSLSPAAAAARYVAAARDLLAQGATKLNGYD